MQELQKLLDAGYEVTFTRGADGIYTVFAGQLGVEGSGRLADAHTPGAALWDVSPFHGPDEPQPPALAEQVAILADKVGALAERQIAVEAVWRDGWQAGRQAGPLLDDTVYRPCARHGGGEGAQGTDCPECRAEAAAHA